LTISVENSTPKGWINMNPAQQPTAQTSASTSTALMRLLPELSSLEDRINPVRVLNRLREETPVRYVAERESWDFFRYEDVQRILQDPNLFTSLRKPPVGPVLLGSIITLDPPAHTQMRAIVSKAFTPKAIAELEPRIASITNELLDHASANGAMDLVHEVSFPLPVIVIAELLGVPAEDRQLFKDWSDIIVKVAEDPTPEAMQRLVDERWQARRELDDYFLKVIAERRKRPQDDLISKLCAAEVDGRYLNDTELLEFCILLLVAGNETTTNLITNAFSVFAQDGELQERLRSHPELIPGAVEETLRYCSPVLATARTATQDVEVGGHLVKKGDRVVTWISSANHDPARFADPHLFLPERSPNQHLAFGFGVHFCLGAPLARLEGKVALKVILQRLNHIRLQPGTTLQPIPSTFVYGFKELPITFEA
jgi:cytochrome P450 family 109